MNLLKLFSIPLLFSGYLLCMQDYPGAGGAAEVNRFSYLPDDLLSVVLKNSNYKSMVADKRFNKIGSKDLSSKWGKLKDLPQDNIISNIINCLNLPEKADCPRYSDFEKVYKNLCELRCGVTSSFYGDLDSYDEYSRYLKVEDMADIDALLVLEKEVADSALKNSIIHTNAHRSTVLSVAVSKGFLKLVELLLDKGVDVSTGSGHDWFTMPLLWAVDCGNLEMVKLLVERGADVNDFNDSDCFGGGVSAYDIAVQSEDDELAEYLLANGAEE